MPDFRFETFRLHLINFPFFSLSFFFTRLAEPPCRSYASLRQFYFSLMLVFVLSRKKFICTHLYGQWSSIYAILAEMSPGRGNIIPAFQSLSFVMKSEFVVHDVKSNQDEG